MSSEIIRQPSLVANSSSWTTVEGDLEIRTSQELADPVWDTFLKDTSGGQYAQSSLWAQTKAFNGWRVMRVTAMRQGRILGGAQMLFRGLPLLGSIGYVPGGPVFATEESRLQEATLRAMLAGAAKKHCHALIVQPARSSARLAEQLPAWGLRPTTRKVMPEYTLLVDLSLDTEALLAQMKPKTRYNTRLGLRKEGLTLREGTHADYAKFYRVLELTGQRQNFKISSEAYYTHLREVFEPQGNLKLFVADHEGELVSAQLSILFGDTVVNKMTVWSGEQGHLKPNEVLLWHVICWAKAQGYRYYDFGGISSTLARKILKDEPLTEKLARSVSSFKLGFGGRIVAFPQAHIYFGSSLLRWIDSKQLVSLEKGGNVKKVMHYLRTR